MEEIKKQIYKYRFQMGFSISQIEKLTKLDKVTIWRWLNKDENTNNNIMGKYPRVLYKLEQEGLKNKIKGLLLTVTSEKGKSRTISYYKIWQVFDEYFQAIGIKSSTAFYRFMDFFVKEEFGSLEKLELKRRPKHEKNNYRKIKGIIQREKGTLEIDATGSKYEHDGITYFIVFIKELYSGYIFNPYVVKAKEDTGAKFYNKAINSLDIAKLLIDLFKEYGIPKNCIIKTDNDKTMTNNFLNLAFTELGIDIKKSAPYNPSSKLIERTIRDLKAWLRIKEGDSFEEKLISAINSYNNVEHNFLHFQGKVKPVDIINTVKFEPVEFSKLDKAFSIKSTRKIINNLITVDNNKYFLQ